jgi:hypothetical protein
MSKKVLTLSSPLSVFISEGLRTKLAEKAELSTEEQEELEKATAFFEVDDLTGSGSFTLSLENTLWSLFEKLKAPESPLRLKAHERFLQDVASRLKDTLESPDDLPQLEVSALKQVLPFVEDPEKFGQMSFPFEYKCASGAVRTIPLPAVNVLSNDQFITLLDEVFTPAAEG